MNSSRLFECLQQNKIEVFVQDGQPLISTNCQDKEAWEELELYAERSHPNAQ